VFIDACKAKASAYASAQSISFGGKGGSFSSAGE
jgi:hypothetical protein